MDNYKNLIVWQKAVELVVVVYELTDKFPKSELYGLVSQIRRCAVSIPSNIAEGNRRGTINEFKRFLLISYGSGGELETQLIISKKLGFCTDKECLKSDQLLNEVMRILNRLINNNNKGL
jgi:four helix bundle protein